MKDDEKYLEYFANGDCVIKFMRYETACGEDIIAKINGETRCKSEDIREIAFYKTGVTL